MSRHAVAYFEQIPNEGLSSHAIFRFSKETEPIIDFWRNTWSLHQFNPIIIGPKVYEDFDWDLHFDFNLTSHIEDKKSKLYSNLEWNSFEYHRARYRRLVAFASFVLDNGTALRADYDVMNYGVTPNFLSTIPSNCAISPERSVVYQDANGVKSTIKAIHDFILNDFDQGASNDFEVLQRYDKEINTFVSSRNFSFTCRDQGEWSMKYKTSPLVHFDGSSKKLKKIVDKYGRTEVTRLDALRCLRPTSCPLKMF
jgi:hypothetical protein